MSECKIKFDKKGLKVTIIAELDSENSAAVFNNYMYGCAIKFGKLIGGKKDE